MVIGGTREFVTSHCSGLRLFAMRVDFRRDKRTEPHMKDGLFSKRRLGIAGIAAFLGCAACCALPLLGVAAVGSGASASLTRFLMPGSELLVGAVVFAGALGVLAIRSRLTAPTSASGCGDSCRADGSCCQRAS